MTENRFHKINKRMLLPKGHTILYFTKGLYILKYQGLEYARNTSWEIVIPPYFESINVRRDYCIVNKQGAKGLLSRKSMIKVECLESPIFSMLLKPEYDDIKEKDGGIIIVKNSMQGLYSIKDFCILLNPCIPIDYPIIPYTLTNEAIGYKKGYEYGYFDLSGNLLFTINLDTDKVSSIRGLKDSKAFVFGVKYFYIFNKDGTYKKTKYEKNWNNTIFHNYDAERWDAMTDGMYGDYPGNDTDYEVLGF